MFSFPLLFFRIWTKKIKKQDDGRVGAGKAKNADNIVSVSQSVPVELYGTVIDTRVWGHIWNASTINISHVSCTDHQRTNTLAIFLVLARKQQRKTIREVITLRMLTSVYTVCMFQKKEEILTYYTIL